MEVWFGFEKRGKGRPKKDPIRGHQVRYGTLSDRLLEAIDHFESEKDKQLIIDLLESLKPKTNVFNT